MLDPAIVAIVAAIAAPFVATRMIRVLDAAGVGDLIPAAWRGNAPTPKELT
ncbi:MULTISPECIES: hypothetical protein [unclassified Pseudoclavibacter]|uniref:hypothetical protein n=1 Tax=unclassified Pseudoclavibacter TaxID=2615177 RepID=UPI0015E3ECDF|nr:MULTISPECIES: hypothetical protein [unclassified Pseudoclavibacter]